MLTINIETPTPRNLLSLRITRVSKPSEECLTSSRTEKAGVATYKNTAQNRPHGARNTPDQANDPKIFTSIPVARNQRTIEK